MGCRYVVVFVFRLLCLLCVVVLGIVVLVCVFHICGLLGGFCMLLWLFVVGLLSSLGGGL